MPLHSSTLRFKRILLTGAAGGLGRELRPRLKAYCEHLRLSDCQSLIGQVQATGKFEVLADAHGNYWAESRADQCRNQTTQTTPTLNQCKANQLEQNGDR